MDSDKNIKALVSGSKTFGEKNSIIYIKDVDCSIAFHGLEEMNADVDLIAGWWHLHKEDYEKYDVCVGGVNDCRLALNRLGVTDYDIPCYPKELDIFLGRKIETASLQEVISALPHFSNTGHMFVKPVRPKRFSAFITNDENALNMLYDVDPGEEVYVSELISFSSEWRVYVKEGKIVRICNYAGHPCILPNTNIIGFMVKYFKGPCCYAIDVGVQGDTTYLVEVNDCYSLGNYGLFPTEYAEMLMLRWKELTSNSYHYVS